VIAPPGAPIRRLQRGRTRPPRTVRLRSPDRTAGRAVSAVHAREEVRGHRPQPAQGFERRSGLDR
jgi:hypothetical protein